MTAPIWMAAPPEVHSTLLTSGPGPGSLLAAAEAWKALSVNYTETADELIEVLAGVHGVTWDGPSAESYVAAHAPYLSWLQQESVNGAARAAEHETAAAAYTAAVAAMPTLGELAANHATRAVLLGTNFLGINTIPIALNEADYARMWVQAATVMSTYEGVADASVAAAPPTQPAPTIAKSAATVDPSNPPAWFTDLENYLQGLFPQPSYPNIGPEYQEILNFFNQIGFTDFNDPIATWLQGLNPSWLPPYPIPGNWLAFTGDFLSYLTPESIAYDLSVPLDPGSYIAFTGIVIVDDFLAIVYIAAFNPQALVLVVPAALTEIVGSTIGNTIQVLHYILEATLPALLPALLPAAAATLVPLAAAPVGLAGLAGLAGLTGLAPAATAPMLAPLIAMAPPPPPPPAPAPMAPAPAPVTLAHAPAVAPAPPPPPTPAGPTGVTMPAYMYVVGDLGLAALRAAGTSTRAKTAAAADAAEIPAVAAVPDEKQPLQRRRPATRAMRGRGYEYMDLDQELNYPNSAPAVTSSDRSTGPIGFAGSAARPGGSEPSGLATLTQDKFGGSSTVPMLPSTWSSDSPDVNDD